METSSKMTTMFKPLFAGKKIFLEANDGKKFICNSAETFSSYIDPDFEKFGLNKSGLATLEILLEIHELILSTMFKQIFPTLNSDLDKLVMTQSQIIRFCEKYPAYLCRDGNEICFLIKEDDKYFVVSVGVDSDGLNVYTRYLKNDDRCLGSYNHRFVVPQLIPLTK